MRGASLLTQEVKYGEVDQASATSLLFDIACILLCLLSSPPTSTSNSEPSQRAVLRSNSEASSLIALSFLPFFFFKKFPPFSLRNAGLTYLISLVFASRTHQSTPFALIQRCPAGDGNLSIRPPPSAIFCGRH